MTSRCPVAAMLLNTHTSKGYFKEALNKTLGTIYRPRLYMTQKTIVKPTSPFQSGGSSCYLASMSSADFDDTRDFPAPHPNLASSLSMSEADESEYLAAVAAAEATSAAEHQSPPVSRVKSITKPVLHISISCCIPDL